MNYELFIARRILSKKGKATTESSQIQAIIQIAVLAVALGIAVMIVSVAIVTGFQHEIRNKLIGFGSHVQITNFDKNESFETQQPIDKRQQFLPTLQALPEVAHVQTYAIKAGIIKTKTDIEGVVLKGVGSDFNWSYFNSKLLAGQSFTVSEREKSNSMVISNYTAKKLRLHVGDNILLYFIQQPPRMRKFHIVGIYETGLEELDKLYVLCDIQQIQKLNDWNDHEVSGFEVLLKDFDQLDEAGKAVYQATGYNFNARTIKELYPQVFDWLHLQDINVYIIIIMMVLVAGINMISALLIIILEKTNTIGLLKAMGASNWSIRKIFLYVASRLAFKGIWIGNAIGLLICVVQKYTGILRLSQENYYVSQVPIHFDWVGFVAINAGTFVLCFLMLMIPSMLILRISPVKAIQFD